MVDVCAIRGLSLHSFREIRDFRGFRDFREIKDAVAQPTFEAAVVFFTHENSRAQIEMGQYAKSHTAPPT